ncbi:unnamed protein product [Peniophora sp. CBMAI 1063]|nr:unnamed protein product [Peniophora sp. CBMAI 1063]
MDRQFTLSYDTKTYHDVVRSQKGNNTKAEARFKRQFSTLDQPDLQVLPFTVWDITGRAELWSISHAITEELEAVIRQLVTHLRFVLTQRGPRNGSKKWRDMEQYFRHPEFCKEFASGVLDLSAAWQMQGHEHFEADMFPSRDFARKGKPPNAMQRATQAFVQGLSTTAVVISAALGIAHPEQYELTRRYLKEVASDPEFTDTASQWGFAFSVLTIVANRSTPIHRDIRSGGRELYDALLTIGGGPHTVIEFPSMGLRVQYDTRTLVLFSGNVHPHGASVSREERVCLAFYARKAMLHKHSLPLPSCPRLHTLLDGTFARMQ